MNLLVGKWPIVVLVACAIYWFMPNDVLLDASPLIGHADDLFLIGLTLAVTRSKP